MARMRQVAPDEAKGKLKQIYASMEKKFGMVPNTFQAMGTNPSFLEGMIQLNRAAGKALDLKTKELIRIAVSTVNDCAYCLDAHFAAAKQAGCTDEEISAAVETAVAMTAFNIFNHGAGCETDISPE